MEKKAISFSDGGKQMVAVRTENLSVLLDGTDLQTMKSVHMQREEVSLGLERNLLIPDADIEC